MKFSALASWMLAIVIAGSLGGWFFKSVSDRNERWSNAIHQYMKDNRCRREYPTENREWIYDCKGEKYLYSEIETKVEPPLKWFN